MNAQTELPDDIEAVVIRALYEDLGDGDRNAALIDADSRSRAVISCREGALLAGTAWFDAVFRQLEEDIEIDWHCSDGQRMHSDEPLCSLHGTTRTLLTGERTALNFLQLLSGIATATHAYVERLKGTQTAIVDTRETLPGLRSAQQYAMQCGGGSEHRFGLHGAILLNASHATAAGSIAAAVERARQLASRLPVQVKVQTLEEVDAALEAGIDAILLDSFATHVLTRAVNMTRAYRRRFRKDITIEACGGIDLRNVREIADTGVDCIAIAGLTRHVRAIDYTMRIEPV